MKTILLLVSISCVLHSNALAADSKLREPLELPLTLELPLSDSLSKPLSVKVKLMTRSTATAPEQPAMVQMMTTREIPPTLPEGRFPQYQLKHRQRERLNERHRESGVLWFELLSGANPLVIRAKVTIDGKPFAKARVEKLRELAETAAERFEASNAALGEPAESTESPDPVDVVPPYRFPTNSDELIARYANATGKSVSVLETKWMLANWELGPELLLLKDPYQWFRADKRPVFQVIDRDQSGEIDKQEFDKATEFLAQCDTNRDELVDGNEIDAAVKHLPSPEKPFTKRLRLIAARDVPADLEFTINFQSAAPSTSSLAITKIGEPLANQVGSLTLVGRSIMLRVDADVYEFSAVQADRSDQISVGVVVEGYPLLSAIDPNGDGRVTLRERRGFHDRLKQHDRNYDGKLSSEEVPPVIRVCFGLGPIVHSELVQLRQAQQPKSPNTPSPPRWFTRMDRNADRDLSRSEFPGTDKQFNDLDVDQDGLIDILESLKSSQNSKLP